MRTNSATSRRGQPRGNSKSKFRPFKNVERALNPSGRRLRVDETTSNRLGQIRQKGTSAELAVRKIVSRIGHRYTTSNRDLPGSPDLASRRHGWAVFVHGCYWHSHEGCPRATVPKNNREFWLAKFARNRERDAEAKRQLEAAGFSVAVLWECEVEGSSDIGRMLGRVLPATNPRR